MHGLTGLSLGSAVGSCAGPGGEALLDKRIDVEAEICPAVTSHKSVWDSGMHLVRYNCLCAITKH